MILLTVAPGILEMHFAVGGVRGNILERIGQELAGEWNSSPISLVFMPT